MSRGDGTIYRRNNSGNFWMQFFLNGRKHRESTGVSDEEKARGILRKRLKEVHASEVTGAVFESVRMRKITVSDLCDALESDFTLRGKWSPQNRSHLKRVSGDFGDSLSLAVTPERIDKYIERRLANKRGPKGELIPGDRPASINRALQLLGQVFNLAVKRGTLSRAPYIRKLSEAGNARKGFCEETEFRKIRGFLPDYLQDFALFAYVTGMRFGEVRSLKWEYVNGDVIELQAEDAKGDGDEENARSIPMVGKDLAGILERRRQARQVKADGTTTLAALIFHHDGRPIVDIRKAWKTACKKAGVPGRLFHDLRRSAVKNLDEAGVSRDVAMSISGHRTQAMYTRYNIADVKRKRKALELTQEFREAQAAQAAQESNVVAISK
jgi:integrase